MNERQYHVWTDQELWDLYCWAEAKRRVGNLTGKAMELGVSASNLGGIIDRARKKIDLIERRLGITPEQRERNIMEKLR